ncbi:MAG: KamA family radical SAM protein [Planctomycetaceae bacterium]|jgi:KamA family protein|nr:KamA family radical SAM protein [Planctomycetaceae bacterium]
MFSTSSSVSTFSGNRSDWRSLLRQNIVNLPELIDILKLPSSLASSDATANYPLNVTRDFVERMEIGNPNDPLLLQILPTREELKIVSGFSCDPLNEMSCTDESNDATNFNLFQNDEISEQKKFNSLFPLRYLQKYSGRVLILAANCCASHCRFCFRRHFFKKNITTCPSSISGDSENEFHRNSTDKIEKHDVHETILSGGDPLMLDDAELKKILHYIKETKTGNRVRLHTRLPIFLPERVTPELIEILQKNRVTDETGTVYVVLHINHSNELSKKATAAIDKFVDSGIPVLSQTVLLRKINDNVETLWALFEKLVNIRVIPYYLHQLDHVQGAAHFEVSIEDGLNLISELQTKLPGYAIPKYVQEIPGRKGKTILSSINLCK